jgi:hypothetical protein
MNSTPAAIPVRCTRPIANTFLTMQTLGTLNARQILYCNVRPDENWFEELPNKNWIAFTIANNNEKTLIQNIAVKCLDKEVSCICSAGLFASETEDYFIDEIVQRNIQKEQAQDQSDDEETSPMLTFHRNFSEGFWFTAYSAYPSIGDKYLEIDKIVCIDTTSEGVKNHLKNLLKKFELGELPTDSEIEEPIYDTSINE